MAYYLTFFFICHFAIAQSTLNLAKKKFKPNSSPLLAHKILASTKTKKIQALPEFKIIELRSFAFDGNIYRGQTPALVLSDKFMALPLQPSSNLEDLLIHNRIFIMAPHYVQLRPVDVDLESKWIFLEADQALSLGQMKLLPRVKAADIPKIFKNKDVARLPRGLLKRNLAEINHNSLANIQNQIQGYGDDLVNAYQQTKERLVMNSISLGPRLITARCDSVSPNIISADLQSQILLGSAVQCESDSHIKISSETNLVLTVQMGILQFFRTEQKNEDWRMRLINDLAEDQLEDIKQKSSQIKYSTPISCESSYLTDKNIDALFCTRSLRGLEAFVDSFYIIGKILNRNYVYSMTHTSGLTAQATKKMMQASIDNLGVSP